MAYDHELADRLRCALAAEPVAEKQMFGGLAFLVGGHLAVSASGQGGLLVRVHPELTEQLLAEPGAGEFEMGGRGPMRGWLRVEGDALHDDAVLDGWVARGVDYARSLPPK